MLVVAASSGVAACINRGQGLARLYDPERVDRSTGNAAAIAHSVEVGQSAGDVQAAAYAEVMRGKGLGG
jgi:hypothetical protein